MARSRRLGEVEEAFILCRALGHQWDQFQPLRRRAAWGTLLSLRCDRCGCERHDTIDSLGEISAREYKHPDGYKVAGEVRGDRVTRAELRLEMLKRSRAKGKRAQTRHLRLA
jgi:hypothetical protein